MLITAEVDVAAATKEITRAAIKAIEKKRAEYEAAQLHLPAAMAIAKQYAATHSDEHVWVGLGSLHDRVMLSVGDARDIRASAKHLIRALRAKGYHRCTEEHTEYQLEFGYHLDANGRDWMRAQIELVIAPSGAEDAVCKRAIVGKETVAKYALVCDDGPLTPEVIEALETETADEVQS